MRLLTAEEIIAINVGQVTPYGERSFVRNPAGLQSIVALPNQSAFDQDAYPDLFDKIGITFIKLIKLHPFEDGNKRTAVVAAGVLARLNGYQLTFSNKEMEALALQVAEVEDRKLDYNQIMQAFKDHHKTILN